MCYHVEKRWIPLYHKYTDRARNVIAGWSISSKWQKAVRDHIQVLRRIIPVACTNFASGGMTTETTHYIELAVGRFLYSWIRKSAVRLLCSCAGGWTQQSHCEVDKILITTPMLPGSTRPNPPNRPHRTISRWHTSQ